jgi:phage shock protein PspC (stress-responsive transcriptional regulator)
MNKFKSFVEWNAFGVCTAIGNRMGIATSRIRQYFIYASLLTMGSPIIIYMVLSFLEKYQKVYDGSKEKSLVLPVRLIFCFIALKIS